MKQDNYSNIAQKIADQLLKDIKEAKYPIGSRLPAERLLAQQFAVSRPTIRNAIRYLESFGCVETRRGAGSYVKAMDFRKTESEDVFSTPLITKETLNCDVIEVRMLLDTEIAAMAAIRRTPEQLALLKKNIAQMRISISQGEQWEEADAAFHMLLCKATNNPVLYNLVEMAFELYTYTTRLSKMVTGDMPEIFIDQHEQLLMAIENRDAERARMLARQHILRTLYSYRPESTSQF